MGSCSSIFLSYKPRYYIRISSPEKSRNNTREKFDTFSNVFDIANQLLTRRSPFAPPGQVDEWTTKPSPLSFLEGKENQIVKKLRIQWLS